MPTIAVLNRIMIAAALAAITQACVHAQPDQGAAATTTNLEDWRKAEQGILANQVQLTFADRFVKAGESYFSPDDSRIIFQAVEAPPEGEAADEFYAMFVADVKRDAAGRVIGLDGIRRISPPGSANTCGWFHPTDPNIVIFASTLTPPTESSPPGYERASGRYRWMFPPEMRIVQCDLRKADGTAASLEVLVGDGKAYVAEGSLSADSRHLLYCSLESNEGDLFVLDLKTGAKHRIVQARGYDGGPFFSPDGKRICYRSDRNNDHYLQLFVADLAFNEAGEIVGITSEHQVTNEPSVNWCPFWTRDGRRLIYASSDAGHHNYELFMVDADSGRLAGSTGTIRYGTGKRRITHADGADVLPAFSHDGRTLIWTSQRHKDHESQLWAADFVFDADAAARPAPAPQQPPQTPPQEKSQSRITVEDPQTGRIFIYDIATHTLSEYDMKSHTLREVTDQADIDLFMKLRESGKAGNHGNH